MAEKWIFCIQLEVSCKKFPTNLHNTVAINKGTRLSNVRFRNNSFFSIYSATSASFRTNLNVFRSAFRQSSNEIGPLG